MKNIINKIFKILNTEAMRYIIVGGCTTLVNLLTFAITRNLLHLSVDISNIISIITAILFAYITNKLFVFMSHCNDYKELFMEFIKFIGGRLFTMVIEVGGVHLLYSIIGQNEWLAKIETQIIVLIANFVISKFLVFTRRK